MEEIKVIDYINYERRLSAYEHLVLFYYNSKKKNIKQKYSEFELPQDLIESYNKEAEAVKQEIAEKATRVRTRFEDKFRAEPWKMDKPVIWSDRKQTDYFKKQLKKSHEFEVYIEYLFEQKGYDIGLYYGKEQYAGECRAGIEIKFDNKFKVTNNVYIEYQERMRKGQEWINSGILKEDNTIFFLIGNKDRFFILPKIRLLKYYKALVVKELRIKGCRLANEKTYKTSKGFLMSAKVAEKESLSITKAIRELIALEVAGENGQN